MVVLSHLAERFAVLQHEIAVTDFERETGHCKLICALLVPSPLKERALLSLIHCSSRLPPLH